MTTGDMGVNACNSHPAVPDRPLGLGRTAGYDQLAEAVAASGFELPRARTQKAADVIARIAVDCINTAKGRHATDKNGGLRSGWTSVSFSEDWWHRAKSDYASSVCYGTVVPAVRALADAGMIAELRVGKRRGRKAPEAAKQGKPPELQTRFRAASCLRNVVLPRTKHNVGGLVRLRDAAGGPARVPVNRSVDRMLRFAATINEAVESASIVLKAPGMRDNGDGTISFGTKGHTVWTDQRQLYRVFNGGFNRGGRYYGGWWQGVSNADRRWFVLDGEATTEIDYETLHPKLLRALLGVSAGTRDEYLIRGYEDQRKLCKIAYNALLNAESLSSALGAVAAKAQKLEDETFGIVRPSPEDGSRVPTDPMYMRLASDLIEAIKRTHPDVATGFHAGIGLTLQNIDSELATAVLREMVVKQGIACLPIHDSFIVAQRHSQALAEAMDTALSTGLARLHVGATSADTTTAYRLNPLHGGIQVPLEGAKGAGAEPWSPRALSYPERTWDAAAESNGDAGIRAALELLAPFFDTPDTSPASSCGDRVGAAVLAPSDPTVGDLQMTPSPIQPPAKGEVSVALAQERQLVAPNNPGADKMPTTENISYSPSSGDPTHGTGSETVEAVGRRRTALSGPSSGMTVGGAEHPSPPTPKRPAFMLRSREEAKDAAMRDLIKRRLAAPMGPRPWASDPRR